MKGIINTPNAPILIESMRSMGYNFSSAISDLIDNSISANAKRIDIIFDPYDDPILIILDDGIGMNRSKLIDSMKFGSKDPLSVREESDLGRFGLGMKSAALSQCRELIVASKQDDAINAMAWNLDNVAKENSWSIVEYELDEINDFPYIEKLRKYESGTYLLLKNFDRVEVSSANLAKRLNELVSELSSHIELIFHRFLENDLEIYINNRKLISKDPFLTSHQKTILKRKQKINLDGSSIYVQPYILPHTSYLSEEDKKNVGGLENLRKNQGFYIYRNRRLIIWGKWFNLSRKHELNKLARVQVDFPNALDRVWNVDIKKSTVTIPDKIKKKLYAAVDESIFGSNNVEEYRGKKERKSKEIEYHWHRQEDRDGSVEYRVNRESLLIKQLKSSLNSEQKEILGFIFSNLEASLPMQNLYLDKSKGKLKNYIIESKVSELTDEAIKQIDILIEKCKDKYEIRGMIEAVLKTERFSNEEVKEKVLKRYEVYYE